MYAPKNISAYKSTSWKPLCSFTPHISHSYFFSHEHLLTSSPEACSVGPLLLYAHFIALNYLFDTFMVVTQMKNKNKVLVKCERVQERTAKMKRKRKTKMKSLVKGVRVI